MVDHKIGRVTLHTAHKTELKPNVVDVETSYLSAIGSKKPGVRYTQLGDLIDDFLLDGNIFYDGTHTIDLEYVMEALRSLKHTKACYNPTDLDQLHGFLGVQDIPTPREAETENLRRISMSGKHMPFSKYTRQIKTYPKIIDNDWSFGVAGVGNDYCNNYLAFPVASTGFTASFNRVSGDGNIPSLLKNSDGEQTFDCTVANEAKGDVRLRDTINEVSESNWIPIFDSEHVFVEKRIMDNAILELLENGADIDLKLYNSSWLDVAKLLAFDISDAILVENDPDMLELNDYDLELLRGAYLARLETEAISTLELKSSHLANPFRFIKEGMNTAVDAWADFDLGNVPSLPKTQNYMLAFTPNRNVLAILALASNTGTWSANSTNKSMKIASYPASKYFWIGALPFDTSYLFKQGEAMTLGGNTYFLKRTGFYQTSGRVITHNLGLLKQDYTTFTEVDPNSHLALVGTDHLDFDAYMNEDCYLYKDYGVDYFGDFEHKVDMKASPIDSDSLGVFWLLSNDIDDVKGLQDASKTAIHVCLTESAGFKMILVTEEYNGMSYKTAWMSGVADTWYYLTITKSGTSLIVNIYSDSARTNLLSFLPLTLHADHKFRYLFGCNTWNSGDAKVCTFDIENLLLTPYLPAIVSTADWNADIGEIYIDDILSNSFTIYNSRAGKDSFSWLIFDNPYELGGSTFNGPGGQTVNHTKGDTNYVPYIIPSADGGGAIGEWWITDYANTSFVVRNSGAAVTAFKWSIARFDNGGKGSSSFAGSGGVTITHNLGISDYTPLIVPTADPGGQLGAVFVTDITTNSFVVRNTGSAITAFDWIIPDMKAITGMEIPVLDAQNDSIYYEFTGYTNLPKGTYQLFVYAKDTDQVINDIRIKVRNQTDGADLFNVTKTLSDSFQYIYAGSFELNADDEGDTIRVTLSKDLATSNSIYIDYIVYEPTISNDDKSPLLVVRRALVEGNIKRELAPKR